MDIEGDRTYPDWTCGKSSRTLQIIQYLRAAETEKLKLDSKIRFFHAQFPVTVTETYSGLLNNNMAHNLSRTKSWIVNEKLRHRRWNIRSSSSYWQHPISNVKRLVCCDQLRLASVFAVAKHIIRFFAIAIMDLGYLMYFVFSWARTSNKNYLFSNKPIQEACSTSSPLPTRFDTVTLIRCF